VLGHISVRRRILVSLSVFSLLVILPGVLHAQLDKMHFSKVFNRDKPYRIFLPENYFKSQKRYPVIYYFHGNTGNHELNIKGVDQLVKDNEVILVAWNGRSVDTDLRPYNIGNHSNINYPCQFKDYFLELVGYIDSTYRTLTDRSNRAVIGHSMGGIMSFFLAGKYPDLIGTAFSSKGSPEFFIGYPENHSLYHVRHMFKNLYGVRLKFATSTGCELFYLNNEVINGALRETDLNFTYQVYEGSHDITPNQFRDAFNFIISSFKDPLPWPQRWHHADLYPDFDIWGYEVRSNLNQRGFIDMKGVTKNGMGICTKKWEPDGVIIPGVKINITTPANFIPNTTYSLLDYNETLDSTKIIVVTSDSCGRITFSVNHESHQLGIYKKNDPPEITFASYKVNDQGLFLDHKKECRLGIRLLNRGGSVSKGIKVILESPTDGVEIINPAIVMEKLGSGELNWLPAEFKIIASNEPVKDGSPFRIRFNLAITDNKNHTWKDEFDVPVYYDVPEFTNIGIDDGDSEIFGSGNGNNIADPGETVMIYEITNGSHRMRLYYDDPYIDSERLYDEIQPDKWGDGYSLSSLIHISKDCPPGHQIRFLASYEVKDWRKIRRDVTWGTFTITIGDRKSKTIDQIHEPVFVGNQL
jgi:enterochelin esterase-like enzyme